MSRLARPRVAIVGAGRMAQALLPLLRRARYRVSAIAAPRLAAARAVAGRSPAIRASIRAELAAKDASLLLLAVPDRAIAPLARELARSPHLDWTGRTVLHHAGALGPEELEPLRRAGAAVGLMHPLQCLGSELASGLLPGSWARIDGDRRGRSVARRLARDLGLRPLPLGRLDGPERVAYHAAAALVSNDLVALFDLAAELFATLGLDRRAALRALAPLARGTLAQLETREVAGAFTGPVRRGDLGTVSAHLARLASLSPEARIAHAALSLALARGALRHGIELPPGTLRGLLRLAGPSRPLRL